MHIHFEKSVNAECDCTILSMSWMGKVPDELPEDEGWKLNRTHYYQEGWLATGNVRGILGVTFTTSHWRKNSNELPLRTNYNLRGHRAQITLVQWNEPYQKLASCDSSGIIFVWIKYEGRWSIELINDRSTPVTHFSWSHDGRMALICYQDGFVLVGSVAGQRYWSSMLNLDATITCGIWTPDDQQVYFGTSNAQVIVMDVHGAMVSQVQLPVDSTIRSMAWSCEKFKMEENEEGEPSSSSNAHFSPSRKEPFILAVAFKNGLVYLMKNYDDIAPIHIWTGMQSLMLEWGNSGEYLAVAGSRPVEVINEAGYRIHEYFNSLYFYNHRGVRVLNIVIPATSSPVTALTWGHNDKRLFVATGKMIHVGWVSKRVASLQLLCRLAIYKSLSNKSCVAHLPLPLPVRALISSLHTQTILSILPNLDDLREFVCHPPSGNLRLYCTMIRHEDDANQSPGTAYTLYLEYLGGLIPILKGKRTSKIRPEFVIYDPQSSDQGNLGIVVRCNGRPNRQRPLHPPSNTNSNLRATSPSNGDLLMDGLLIFSDSSESEDVELCASPHMQRRRYRNRIRERERERLREQEREWERSRNGGQPLIPDPVHVVSPHQLIYTDVLPESMRLVEVTSNIWGTKFKIHGLASSLPDSLGQVTYKTSLLHLQPRQMTLLITELRDDIFLSPESVLNNTNYNQDDEEDFSVVVNPAQDSNNCETTVGSTSPPPVVAPASRCFLKKMDPGDKIDQVDPNDEQDEFPYVDLQANPDMVHFRQALKSSLRSQRLGSLREPRIPDPSPKHVTVTVTTTAEVQLCEKRGQSVDEDCRAGPSSGSTRSSIRSPTRISWTGGVHGSPSREAGHSSANNPGPSRVNVCPTTTPPPIYVRRSFSASYLDGVEHPGQVTLDIVSQDLLSNSHPKRLVLVKNRSAPKNSNPRLKECGKSKSWDSCDLSWWRANPTAADPKVTCPKCSFPTVNKAKDIRDIRSPFAPRANPSSCMTPPTPARRKSGCYLPSSSRGPGAIPQKIKPRGSISEVDRIERACESESEHWVNCNQPSPPSSPSPPPPQVTHRRSISLLTPLLKRREMAAANKQRTTCLNPQSAPFTAPGSPQHHRSQPTTPAMQRKSRNRAKEGYRYLYSASSPIRQLFLNSPLFPRKNRGSNPTTPKPDRRRMTQETQTLDNSSDEEDLPKSSIPSRSSPFTLDPMGSMGQLRSRLSKKKIHVENSPIVPRRMQFVMHNKAPMWNENSQVYQLDFGGRVTQESAKNFQIEFRGKQVMQFGRIDGNAYTLDFQYPFSALQAFAVALANVTQRLK